MTVANVHQITLTEAQERYCVLRAAGETQLTSYARSHVKGGLSNKTLENRAAQLEKRAGVADRIRVLIAEKKVSDVLSVGTALTDLLEDMKGAREAKNWTALATFHRLTLQVLGLLKENIVLSEEQRMTDEELIKRLTQGNSPLARDLALALGKPDAFRETIE